jgi:O-antigen/teichoic acid export membrane protein
MSLFGARRWLVGASLVLAGAAFCFFVLAPVLGYPLRYSQAQSLLRVVLPVFLGYLGAATQFAFQKKHEQTDPPASPMLPLLVIGPIALFVVMMVVGIVAFGYSNRAQAPPGDGMSAEQLGNAVSGAMGLLAVTTNVIVAYLFRAERKSERTKT